MTYPDAEVVTTAYNIQGLPATLSGYVTNALYNAAGQLTSIELGNTVRTTYGYHAKNARLTDLVTDAASNQTEMRYDWLGRKTWMSDLDLGAWSYGYDDARNKKTSAKARRSCLSQRNDPTIQLHNL
jgi:YD repeat-containing protein